MDELTKKISNYVNILKIDTEFEQASIILKKLTQLQITVDILQRTGIGKVVNGLRKQPGDVGRRAKELVAKWKELVITSEVLPPENDPVGNRYETSNENRCMLVSNEPEKSRTSSKTHRSVTVESDVSYTSYGDSENELAERGMPNQIRKSLGRDSTNGSSHTKIKEKPDSKNSSRAQSGKVKSSSHSIPKYTDKLDKSRNSSKKNIDHDQLRTGSSPHIKSNSSKSSRDKVGGSAKEENVKRPDTSHKVSTDDQKKEPSIKSSGPQKRNAHMDRGKGGSDISAKKKKRKISIAAEDGFDSTMTTFEDCLGFNDLKSVSKKSAAIRSSPKPKNRSTKPAEMSPQLKSPSSSSSHSSSGRKAAVKLETRKVVSSSDDEQPMMIVPKSTEKPLSSVDIESTLPAIQPNYKPMRYNILDSPPAKKKSGLSEADAGSFMSSKNTRTQVFSGRKTHFLTGVPSLYEMCIKVLQENIDALEYTGGVPYDRLKPVLERCTPHQLYQIEDFNPYLTEDTDELWMEHAQHDFKKHTPDEMETWREFYLRKFDEREAKLKSITANISASMAKAVPVRQTKLAYVDSVAKPPRNIARKQAKYGTSRPDKPGPGLIKLGHAPPKAARKPMTSGAMESHMTASSSSSLAAVPVPSPVFVPPPQKVIKKVAPLMQKTLRQFKGIYRK